MGIAQQPRTLRPSRSARSARSGAEDGFTLLGPGRRRAKTLVVGALCALALAAAPVPAHAEDVPGQDALTQALLEPADVGPNVVLGAAGAMFDDSPDPTSCPALETSPTSPFPGVRNQGPQVELMTDTFVIHEQLIAGPPATVAAGHALARDALATCTSLTFPIADGPPLTVALSPVQFGGPGSVAVRMDGVYLGTPVNGYLAFEPLGAVELVYAFFQIGDGSSQVASAVYQTAVDKIHRTIGPAADPTQFGTPAVSVAGSVAYR